MAIKNLPVLFGLEKPIKILVSNNAFSQSIKNGL